MTIVNLSAWEPGAPKISAIAGEPPWSGKSSKELTDEEILEMYAWCKAQAWKAGQTDSLKNLTATDCRNPFEPRFLGGVPAFLWSHTYRLARQSAAPAPRDHKVDPFVPSPMEVMRRMASATA